jgi:antibiotic biosynthesis monooxygenase (ABM) superfamily enzyme
MTTLTKELDDPTAIRQASITEPTLRQAGQEQRYAVCMRFDSRDQLRHYLGLKERIAYFYAGHLNQLVTATSGQCNGAAYKPWPELEKLCLAKNCT